MTRKTYSVIPAAKIDETTLMALGWSHLANGRWTKIENQHRLIVSHAQGAITHENRAA